MKKVLGLSTTLLAGVVIGTFLIVIPVTAQRGAGGMASQNGDTNGDGVLDISDAVYLLIHLFKNGNPPVAIAAESPELLTHVAAIDGKLTQLTDLLTSKLTEVNSALKAPQLPCKERTDRFVDNGGGTVTDICTGLMWQQTPPDIDGNTVFNDPDRQSWQDADQYCRDLELAGFFDWRLPTTSELISIYDDDFNSSIFRTNPVLGGPSSDYWSASPTFISQSVGTGDIGAWYVNFTPINGSILHVDLKTTKHFVRAVSNFR